MAKIYYIGDWAVQLGPVYAETSFNHAPKGLDFIKYAGVTVLTPNLREAARAAGFEQIDSQTPVAAGEKILSKIKL